MTAKLLTGNSAAAWGARLAPVDYIPAFPITPQTEIIEDLAFWVDRGELDARLVTLESEHSMITAAAAAASSGVRAFTATSSQGLLYGMEMIYTVSGWRTPFVLVNVSRGLASPITLESDHNDIMAARDSGFLQIHCATCQEIADGVLIAYRLAEHPEVRVPAIVNLDGFYLSFTREPVDLPDASKAAAFVGEYDPENLQFKGNTPLSQAMAVLGGGPYSYFRYETHLAVERALSIYDEVIEEFAATFGRRYDKIDAYCMDDADYVFIMLGSFSTKARDAVDSLRAAGNKIGLLRPRLFRPLPAALLRQWLRGRRAVAVIDQNISMGMGGILHSELATALYGIDKAPLLASYIGGLGGRDISQQEFFAIADELNLAYQQGAAPPVRLLYTRNEMTEMRKLQAIAQAEHAEIRQAEGKS
ncbi:MAG: pyruvate synthase [Gammaproteobacteria bacterium]|nr:MAG: pyruvate synthase [Gammaproteobacteria bacterium]UCH38867.1 MAG: pyruvate synthase [Gammaproteobacteria bacterium]